MDLKACRAFLSVSVATMLLGAMPALAQYERMRRCVPEFDPTTVGAIAALLVGGGALLARRRR
jgi:MYXO-CTERM domain-containing protein